MEEKLVLRYRKSASEMKLIGAGAKRLLQKNPMVGDQVWQQAVLPLGNGAIGMSVYGDVPRERITLNHKTLWAGGPSPLRPDYAGGNILKPDRDGKLPRDYYREIRQAFQAGRSVEASALCDKLVGKEEGYGSYLCWGEWNVAFDHEEKIDDYWRTLDLERAICNVGYRAGAIEYRRSYFVSRPDRVAVCRLQAQGGTFSATLSIASAQSCPSVVDGEWLRQNGSLQDNGLQFSLACVCRTDGKVTVSGDCLRIADATTADCFVAMDTDYYDNYPVYRTGESARQLQERVDDTARKAACKGYAAIYEDHIEDFGSIFGRVRLDLDGASGNRTTDELLARYGTRACAPAEKRALERLLFAYGRYLTISCSREGDLLPSNLQGIWNCSNRPAWSCDFHLNINLQMNYWPTYNTSMAECAMPLIRFIDRLREPGRVTARAYTGSEQEDGKPYAFVCHNQNTPYGWTCPGWSFDWGWSPVSAAWILHNIFEYYQYTRDLKILKDKIYPMLKESAAYFRANLFLDPVTGRLVSVPSYSPEHGPRTMGNTYEQTLICQLFYDCIEAARALGVDADLQSKLSDLIDRLNPIEIGQSGQIKEWYHEKKVGKIGQKRHRHLSHLLGLYPCALIDKRTMPSQFKAARVSLERRGDKSTGWAMGQRINTWARLGDGERAYRLIGTLFTRGIYPNLWDTHPPFQIDGNFAYTAGVCEMLMQSHLGEIELLPALPAAWAKGSVSGLTARGAVIVDMVWENGELISGNLTPTGDGKLIVRYAKIRDYRLYDRSGKETPCDRDEDTIAFAGQAGERYCLCPIGRVL